MAKIIELILAEERMGDGTDASPIRLLNQLWSKDGKLVAESDANSEKTFFNPENI